MHSNKFLAWLTACALAITPASATRMTLTGAGVQSSGGFSCAQSSALQARMDGGQNASAVDTLVCGLVTDGVYSLLDGLWVMATNSTGNATLNWAQNAFNLTWTNLGNCTFTPNAGLTGTGLASSCWADTGYNLSTGGGNYALNSATIGSCVLASRATSQSWVQMGAASQFSYFQLLFTGQLTSDINANNFPVVANANAQGSWILSRTLSTAFIIYQNGILFSTRPSVSGVVVARNIYLMAFNNSGSAANFTGDQASYFVLGGGLTALQVLALRTRLQTYMATVNGSGC